MRNAGLEETQAGIKIARIVRYADDTTLMAESEEELKNLLMKVKVKSLSRVLLLVTPWTAAYQAPPSMGFSRQEYWSGVPLPSLATLLLGCNLLKCQHPDHQAETEKISRQRLKWHDYYIQGMLLDWIPLQYRIGTMGKTGIKSEDWIIKMYPFQYPNFEGYTVLRQKNVLVYKKYTLKYRKVHY